MLGESVHTVKKNTEASVIASKEINLDALLTKLSTVELHLSGRWLSGANYPDCLGTSGKFVENSTKLNWS
jgi:hypothetical protein